MSEYNRDALYAEVEKALGEMILYRLENLELNEITLDAIHLYTKLFGNF